MKYLVQVLNEVPTFMRKHWHTVDADTPEKAVVELLRMKSKAVPRLARKSGGKLYVSVAPVKMGSQVNVRDNGMPIVAHGFNVGLNRKAA